MFGVTARAAGWFVQANVRFQAASGCWGAVEGHGNLWKLLSLGAVGTFATCLLVKTTFKVHKLSPLTLH
jgi:hypothetical protein